MSVLPQSRDRVPHVDTIINRHFSFQLSRNLNNNKVVLHLRGFQYYRPPYSLPQILIYGIFGTNLSLFVLW